MKRTVAALLLANCFGGLLMAEDSADRLSLAAGRVGMRRVLIIAHRGDSKAAPENTLPAFESAVKARADLVELDYHHSADGVPVVFHDKELDKRTNALQLWEGKEIPIASKSYDELRQLDAGGWFSPDFAGTRIPKLDEALDCIQQGSITLIERKQGDAETCIDLLEAKGLLGGVVIQAFDWDYLEDCRRRSPAVVLGALGEKELSAEMLDRIQAFGASAVGWNEKHLTKAYIDAIHQRGMKAWAWTVDDPGRARQLVDWGLDGVITNVPSKMRAEILPTP